MADTKLNTKKFDLAKLVGAEYNPRGITPVALQGLRESIDTFGLMELPIVNIKDGKRTIVAGHQRVKAMLHEGISHADCVVVNFDLTTEMSANITLNNPAVQGVFDHVAAMPVLESIESQLPHRDAMGFDQLMDDIQRKNKPNVELSGEIPVDLDVVAEVVSEVGATYTLGTSFLTVSHESGARPSSSCVGLVRMPNTGIETYDSLVEWLTLIHERAGEGCYIFTNNEDIVSVVDAWMGITKQMPTWFAWGYDKPVPDGGGYKRQVEMVVCCGVPSPGHVKISARREGRLPTFLVRDLLERTGDLPIFAINDGGTALLVSEGLGRICYAVTDDPTQGDDLRKTWTAQKFGSGTDWKKETPKLT
jgi:hypothetical protein